MRSPAELLPLRPPSLYLESVERVDDARAECAARVPPESALAADGTVPAFAALEIAAQAAGAHGSWVRTNTPGWTPPEAGYLVLLRDVVIPRDSFAAGAQIRAEVALDGEAEPLAIYRFRVSDGEGVIAEGTLGTYVTGA